MSKKVISLLLAVMLTAAMIVVAAIAFLLNTDVMRKQFMCLLEALKPTIYISVSLMTGKTNIHLMQVFIGKTVRILLQRGRVIQLAMLISKMFTVLMYRPMLIK